MDEYFAYLDEAGDEGFGKLRTAASTGQSRWLLIGGIIVDKENDANLPKWRDEIMRHTRKQNRRDLHFQNLNHDQRVMATRRLADKPFGASVICSYKETILDLQSAKPKLYEKFKQKGHLYNYLTRFFLERMADVCVRRSKGRPCKLHVTFSKRANTDYQEMRDYLFLMRNGEEVKTPKRSIDWSVLNPEDIRVENHSKRAGLQIADVVTSATYKALEPNQYGDVEPRYVVNLRNRFIRKNSSVRDEGVAFAPWQASDIEAAQKTLKLLD